MNAISQNHLDFAARVARIEKNVAGSRQLLFVGVDEVYSMPRRDRKPKPKRGGVLLGRAVYPVGLVAAVALGALSHALGQIARFHVQGLPDLKSNPDTEMLVQVGVGVVIAMVLGYLLQMNGRRFLLLSSVGVILGVLVLHNAVHLWPGHFATVTSDPWVDQVIGHSKAASLMWRGISFQF